MSSADTGSFNNNSGVVCTIHVAEVLAMLVRRSVSSKLHKPNAVSAAVKAKKMDEAKQPARRCSYIAYTMYTRDELPQLV